MGNVTNICSDKTGTLTQNTMTVVEGWFANTRVLQGCQQELKSCEGKYLEENNLHTNYIILGLFHGVKISEKLIVENISINRSAFYCNKIDPYGILSRSIVGNKTEAALMSLICSWGYDCDQIKQAVFNEENDQLFSFNSDKKRSTAIVHRSDGSGLNSC